MSFTTRLDERLKIAGNPLPAEVSTIRTALLTVDTGLVAATKFTAPVLAKLEDEIMNFAEEIASQYRPNL